MNRAKIRAYFDKYTYNVGLEGVRTLDNCYKECSTTKRAIWQDHKNKNPGARYMSVITHNCHSFTMGWLEKDGDDIYFRVETRAESGKMLLGSNEKIELKRQGIWL